MFMSRRALLWLHITALRSGAERGGKMVDRVTEGRYAWKKEKGGFFINRTTVSPPSNHLRRHPGSLQVAGAL